VGAPDGAGLLSFIQSQPEINSLEIHSIACRKAGCEIQILGSEVDQTDPHMGVTDDFPEVVRRAQSSRFSESLQTSLMYAAPVGTRIAYVVGLKRIPRP
jgi:hypothetical protein